MPSTETRGPRVGSAARSEKYRRLADAGFFAERLAPEASTHRCIGFVQISDLSALRECGTFKPRRKMMAHLNYHGAVARRWKLVDGDARYYLTETNWLLRTTGPRGGNC